jgi:hypothetical protein
MRIHLIGRTRLPGLPGHLLSLLASGCIAIVAFPMALAVV